MDIKIQIICIIVSFLYGILLYITNSINNKINKSKNIIIHMIIDILYTFIIVLLYIVIIYKINKGIFHIYFFLIMSISYYLMSKYVNFPINFTFRLKSKINK